MVSLLEKIVIALLLHLLCLSNHVGATLPNRVIVTGKCLYFSLLAAVCTSVA